MRVAYDAEVDVLSIVLSDAAVVESDQEKRGVILDSDCDGNVVGLEILEASWRVKNPQSVEVSMEPGVRRPA